MSSLFLTLNWSARMLSESLKRHDPVGWKLTTLPHTPLVDVGLIRNSSPLKLILDPSLLVPVVVVVEEEVEVEHGELCGLVAAVAGYDGVNRSVCEHWKFLTPSVPGIFLQLSPGLWHDRTHHRTIGHFVQRHREEVCNKKMILEADGKLLIMWLSKKM